MNKPLIIAHRGFHENCHENTLQAIEAAINIQADFVEFDVRKTRDGVFVLHHDDNISEIKICDVNFSDFAKLTQSYEIPKLTDVLVMTKGRIKLDVELKEKGYEVEVIKLIQGYFNKSDFFVTTFIDDLIPTIKLAFPEVKVGLLLGKKLEGFNKIHRLKEIFPARRIKKCHADFIVPYFKLLKFRFLKRAKNFSEKIFIWTVNDENLIETYLQNPDITGIVTDKPDFALKLRDRLPKSLGFLDFDL